MATVLRIRVRPSADIARARDVLRALLLRYENSESVELVGTVKDSIEEIANRLDSLAGLQTMFEEFGKS